MEYQRNPKCECAKYKDLDTLSFAERKNIKEYWLRGFIYADSNSAECSCHKIFRLTGRYNRLAEKIGLPIFEELSKMKYVGEKDSFKKLKSLPDIIRNNNLKDVLVYVFGPHNCQKTTSLAKLAHQIVVNDYSISFLDFNSLIERYTSKDESLKKDLDVDWLIIDNCFEGETVNFKTVYNSFYNLLLNRKKPTVICSPLSMEELLVAKDLPSYNKEAIQKIISKVNKYKTVLPFTDDIAKLSIIKDNKNVDIWSL